MIHPTRGFADVHTSLNIHQIGEVGRKHAQKWWRRTQLECPKGRGQSECDRRKLENIIKMDVTGKVWKSVD